MTSISDPLDYNISMPPDATFWNGALISKSIDGSRMLTKGSYKLTFFNPEFSKKAVLTEPIEDTCSVFDPEKFIEIPKKYSVDQIEYDYPNNRMVVDITIEENPIPIFILYGAVIGVIALIGAWSTTTVLEKVEETFVSVTSSPITYGIILVLLLPLLMPLMSGKK